MRERSYLTPLGQAAVGGLVLIACLAWPPLIFVFLLLVLGRCVRRARTGNRLVAYGVLVLLIALPLPLMYLLPPAYAPVILVVGLVTATWFIVGRRRWNAAAI